MGKEVGEDRPLAEGCWGAREVGVAVEAGVEQEAGGDGEADQTNRGGAGDEVGADPAVGPAGSVGAPRGEQRHCRTVTSSWGWRWARWGSVRSL